MGPVSFEPVAAGSTRDEAMEAARTVAAVGVQVASIREEVGPDGEPQFQLIVRGNEAVRAREALDSLNR